MIYLDLTPGELEKLFEFHKQNPENTLRVFSDEVIDKKQGTYRKTVSDLKGHICDIAEKTFK
jgi:hypothetical protein